MCAKALFEARDMLEWTANGNIQMKWDASRESKPCCPHGQRESELGCPGQPRQEAGVLQAVSLQPLKASGRGEAYLQEKTSAADEHSVKIVGLILDIKGLSKSGWREQRAAESLGTQLGTVV